MPRAPRSSAKVVLLIHCRSGCSILLPRDVAYVNLFSLKLLEGFRTDPVSLSRKYASRAVSKISAASSTLLIQFPAFSIMDFNSLLIKIVNMLYMPFNLGIMSHYISNPLYNVYMYLRLTLFVPR